REDVAAALVAAYGDAGRGAIEPVWQRTGGNPYELAELLAVTPDPATLQTASAELTELTAREIDVLACLADGMSNQQVASHLGISIRTVTVHVSNLLRKTRCRSRTDAALWAVRNSYSSAGYSSATTTSS
ncbi:MAG TPA: LuxR C-terminal-related transcriptional regulator, partial [Micromonosporaceae bacterium]